MLAAKIWHITNEIGNNIKSDTFLSYPAATKKSIHKRKSFTLQVTRLIISAFTVLAFAFPAGTYAFSLSSMLSLWSDEKSVATYDANPEHMEVYSYEDAYKKENYKQNDYVLSPIHKKTRRATGGGSINISENAILLPNPSYSSPLESTGVHKDKKDNISIYVVQKGDTLSEIAEKFGVTVNTIKWANDLKKTDSIKIGQKLVILPVTGVKYVVKNGGTLKDIIKKVGGSIEEAAAFNGVEPDEYLAKGTELIIPNGEIKEPKKKAVKIKSYVRSTGTGKVVRAGYFIRPVKGGVRTQGIHGHNAVDLASTYGAAIYAAASGQVIISKSRGWNGGYGHYVVIKHPNGTQTLYSHLSKNFVSVGDQVKQGQVIGAMGSTGRSTGVHLHFEVRGARNPF